MRGFFPCANPHSVIVAETVESKVIVHKIHTHTHSRRNCRHTINRALRCPRSPPCLAPMRPPAVRLGSAAQLHTPVRPVCTNNKPCVYGLRRLQSKQHTHTHTHRKRYNQSNSHQSICKQSPHHTNPGCLFFCALASRSGLARRARVCLTLSHTYPAHSLSPAPMWPNVIYHIM